VDKTDFDFHLPTLPRSTVEGQWFQSGVPGSNSRFDVLIVLCISFHCQNPESAGTLGFSATLNCRNPILQYFTITFTSFQSERIVLEKKRIRVVVMDIFREGFFSVTLLPQGLIRKTE